MIPRGNRGNSSIDLFTGAVDLSDPVSDDDSDEIEGLCLKGLGPDKYA